MKDYLTKDFSTQNFQVAFKQYFNELVINVDNWDELFESMNSEADNLAFVRLNYNNEVIGFIQFKIDILKNCFFEEKIGFIREFWISDKFRKCGQGTDLLLKLERYFLDNNVFKVVLTTDTAQGFYSRLGYINDRSYKAINDIEVFTKILNK